MHNENNEQEEKIIFTINEEQVREFFKNNYDRKLTKKEMELIREEFIYGDGVSWQTDVLMDEAIMGAIKDLQQNVCPTFISEGQEAVKGK